MTVQVYGGHCLCGAVRFEAQGSPKWAAYCPCESFRRAIGAPVSAYAGFESTKVKWSETAPTAYASSRGVKGGLCNRCGSTLFYVGTPWPDETHLHLCVFDEPQRIVPNKETFREERILGLPLTV